METWTKSLGNTSFHLKHLCQRKSSWIILGFVFYQRKLESGSRETKIQMSKLNVSQLYNQVQLRIALFVFCSIIHFRGYFLSSSKKRFLMFLLVRSQVGSCSTSEKHYFPNHESSKTLSLGSRNQLTRRFREKILLLFLSRNFLLFSVNSSLNHKNQSI